MTGTFRNSITSFKRPLVPAISTPLAHDRPVVLDSRAQEHYEAVLVVFLALTTRARRPRKWARARGCGGGGSGGSRCSTSRSSGY